jgi:hypothetical protein
MTDFIGTNEQLCNALNHIEKRASTSHTDIIVVAAAQALIEEKDERIEELEQDCEIISSEFESDLWVVCRRLLTKTHFDFSHSHVDGIHTDEFEGHMNETLAELDRSEARIAELEDLLGRYANGVAKAEGVFFEPEDSEGEYIIELAKRARANETPLSKPKPGQFSVPQSRS